MAYVNMSEQWVRFSHPLKDGHCSDPEADSQADPPPRCQAECEAYSDKNRAQDKFAIAAQQLVGPVGRLVDYDFSGPVGDLHGLTPTRR